VNRIAKKKKIDMSTTNTIAKVFDTVLSIPGMNDNVKIQLSIPRKNVLLLSKVIERGLTVKDDAEENNILDIAPKETVQELKAISEELLKKAGLIEMNEKLKTF
jgi:hypothetical protein